MPASSRIVPTAIESATPLQTPRNSAARTAPVRPQSPRETTRAAVAEITTSAAPDIAAAGAKETGGDSLYASGDNLQAVLSGAFGSSRRSDAPLAPKSSRFDSIKGKAHAAAALRRFAPDAVSARGADAIPLARNAADSPATARSAWSKARGAVLGRFIKTLTLSVFSALLVFAPGISAAQAPASSPAAPAQVDGAPGQVAAPKDAVAIAAEKVVVRVEVSKEAVTV
ncbi:MAG: hypothetical protein CO113_13120, partial [Elusimicrobia bacterium CG_4_9_14_3_um_filter_62_55]